MVYLRKILPEDQERMLDILTSDKVNRTYMLPDFERREDAAPLFHKLMDMSRDDGKYVRAIATEDGLAGFLNHTEIQGTQIELGYAIHPTFHGKGYMTEALQLAMDELFDLGYDEILTGAFSTNAASIRVMEKCGMKKLKKTDAISYRDKTHTCVYYSRKREALVFLCCFCGNTTTPGNSYAISIRHAQDLSGPEQTLYCCRICLEQRLTDQKLLYLKYM